MIYTIAMQTIHTIGHSTRSITEFIELLQSHAITQLVDIRTIPKSRHNPQFGQQEIRKSLEDAGIRYVYLQALGGLRPATKRSVNGAWHNLSFRNYADYMQTDEFTQGLNELLEISKKSATAIMCAEAVPWRCHRSLVSDALLIRNVSVCEIIGKDNVREHKLTSFAVADGVSVTYPKSALEAENE